MLGSSFAAICSPLPEPQGGAEEALASIADEMIEARLFRQMAVDSSSPNP
jgi:hypothetical protein